MYNEHMSRWLESKLSEKGIFLKDFCMSFDYTYKYTYFHHLTYSIIYLQIGESINFQQFMNANSDATLTTFSWFDNSVVKNTKFFIRLSQVLLVNGRYSRSNEVRAQELTRNEFKQNLWFAINKYACYLYSSRMGWSSFGDNYS